MTTMSCVLGLQGGSRGLRRRRGRQQLALRRSLVNLARDGIARLNQRERG